MLQQRYALDLAAVGTGAGWVLHRLSFTDPDAAIRLSARRFASSMIHRAGELGAPVIIGSMQGRIQDGIPREQAIHWLTEALEELGSYAASSGVKLLYEPLNRYETNLFNRLGDAFTWLRSLSARNLRLVADLFHMGIEEQDLAHAVREAGSLIGHVHFADSNRRAVGYGDTDVAPIVAALRQIGYSGYLSAEIFPIPDTLTAARQTMAAFGRFVGGR